MNVIVTGGAGYIGSHTCKILAEQGYTVIVYDNLCTGHRELIRWGPLEHGDIRDYQHLRFVLKRYHPDGVIHFASFIAVGESMQDPAKYYDNNVIGSLRLMEAMRDEGIPNLVVSGTAAVYGLPEFVPIAEQNALAPINPYGRTKLVMEWMLRDFADAYGLRWMSLRYFNAAGGDPEVQTGEWHEPETHLIPNVLRAVDGLIPALQLFGNDYDTPDGTCIRDYVHVSDLAAAHVLALQHLLGDNPSLALNLGTGMGISVREILEAARQVTGRDVPYVVKERRPGDPARLMADAGLARRILGWQPRHTAIADIISTAWAWHCRQREKGIFRNR